MKWNIEILNIVHRHYIWPDASVDTANTLTEWAYDNKYKGN